MVAQGGCEEEEVNSKVAAYSFMSETGCFYLGSVGLLGEYCPTTRKRHKQFVCPSSPPIRLHVAHLIIASRFRESISSSPA